MEEFSDRAVEPTDFSAAILDASTLKLFAYLDVGKFFMDSEMDDQSDDSHLASVRDQFVVPDGEPIGWFADPIIFRVLLSVGFGGDPTLAQSG